MTTSKYIKTGRLTALISFLSGTGIFLLFYLTSEDEFLFIGYAFIIFMLILNTGVFISILIKAGKDKNKSNKFIKTLGLMLLNIPVMLVYCWIAFILLGTMRIKFTNSTPNTLKDMNIVGCGGGYLDKLEAGESETVWVKITGDCAIFIDYLQDRQRKKERVAGYVTSGMGKKIEHDIDGQDNDIL